ncbi:hypothetical protein EUX98_g4080 [Antrodiella citrinella]|uniref:Uncharacterized protein n=1 Tax=Antrodiella citrinella TaxID=2447956 RepID=A0A4S4MXR4_9APHY|nr:hypothetical protein EUX98_g4080 [Antrodiella citrinella]
MAPGWQSALLSKTKKNDDGHVFGPSATEIVPRLYLSNFFFARSAEGLRDEGITHVISVMEQIPIYGSQLKGTLHVPLEDTSDANILRHLDTTTGFIKATLEESTDHKVLVHCLMGISRSATVVCAYLVATTSMTASEAIDFVKAKRPIICPNLGFRRQLETYSVRFYTGQGSFAAKSVSRITGVGQSIRARVKKMKSRSSLKGAGMSRDGESEETVTSDNPPSSPLS